MQKRQKYTNKPKKDNSKIFIFLVTGFLFGIVLGIVFANVTTMNLTGEAVRHDVTVKNHGMSSNYPISVGGGAYQSTITIYQPTLKNMQRSSTAILAAQAVGDLASIGVTTSNVYRQGFQWSPPSSIIEAAAIITDKATDYFAENSRCMTTIGQRYGSFNSFQFVLVTKVKTHNCWSDSSWQGIKAEHSYYTTSGRFICSQTTDTLFSVQKNTGEIASAWGC